MARLLFVSFLESLAWAAILVIFFALMGGCVGHAPEEDPLGSLLAGCVLVAGWAGACGWYLRGWYDRRMRPTIEPSEDVTRIGQRWAASLAQIDRSLS